MSSKHTPGPWEVAEEDGELFVQVVNQPASCHPMFDRYRIIHGYVGGDPTENPTPDLGTPEANARLIAAAPELLEAALSTIDTIEGGPTQVADAITALRAAIAKATGEGA
ncbi:hypothetical protein [Stenotrophomonas sp. OVS01A]|uniref:hypothetical protein n=1 Tax=Stenotrophomonas sp. OVS01A TaxID=2862680 RepID=UPI001CBE05ED|nr:hypothetical protein [Stenotrophomonas sp. OVS01A]